MNRLEKTALILPGADEWELTTIDNYWHRIHTKQTLETIPEFAKAFNRVTVVGIDPTNADRGKDIEGLVIYMEDEEKNLKVLEISPYGPKGFERLWCKLSGVKRRSK